MGAEQFDRRIMMIDHPNETSLPIDNSIENLICVQLEVEAYSFMRIKINAKLNILIDVFYTVSLTSSRFFISSIVWKRHEMSQ